ncbi:hypothetical protein D3C80_1672360 [compost metagenome]
MRVRIGHRDRLQAAIDHVADLEQELAKFRRNAYQQLLLDLHQQFLVWQFQRDRDVFVEFA